MHRPLQDFIDTTGTLFLAIEKDGIDLFIPLTDQEDARQKSYADLESGVPHWGEVRAKRHSMRTR